MTAGRGLVVLFAHQVRVVRQPLSGLAQHLLMSQPQSWLDTIPVDQIYQAEVDGDFGVFPIAATVQQAPAQDVPQVKGLEAELETRIVALGSEASLANAYRKFDAGFSRAAFSWVTDQEHRIIVPARDPDLRYLPRTEDNAPVVIASKVAQFYLPGGTFLLGLLVWILRSRSSGRRRVSTPGRGPSPS